MKNPRRRNRRIKGSLINERHNEIRSEIKFTTRRVNAYIKYAAPDFPGGNALWACEEYALGEINHPP